MRRLWSADELGEFWTILPDDLAQGRAFTRASREGKIQSAGHPFASARLKAGASRRADHCSAPASADRDACSCPGCVAFVAAPLMVRLAKGGRERHSYAPLSLKGAIGTDGQGPRETRFGLWPRGVVIQPSPCGRERPPSLWKGELEGSDVGAFGAFLILSLTPTKAEVCRGRSIPQTPRARALDMPGYA